MRDHPIPPVTEPLQYRAIGIVRGIYSPEDTDQFTRGRLVDLKGEPIEAVVLGRVLTLMRRHLEMNEPHLWIVYPRCRDEGHLHLQIAGVWEPSTLGGVVEDNNDSNLPDQSASTQDDLPEGDDYFSIRGELIFTRPETNDLVVKVRQRPRADGSRPLPFKLKLKGDIPLEFLRNFVSLEVRRSAQNLQLEKHEVLGPVVTRGGKRRGVKGAPKRRGGT